MSRDAVAFGAGVQKSSRWQWRNSAASHQFQTLCCVVQQSNFKVFHGKESFQRGDDLSFDQTETFANIQRVDNLCVEGQQVSASGIDLINAVQDALPAGDIVEHPNRAR